ncbi:C40 family peptidase [Aerococcaceae bacterium DSM 111020]|nr:C40 family peptidase [Aerococcaceae bacterium DSM 111020]
MKKSFSKNVFKKVFASAIALTSTIAPMIAHAQDYDTLIGDSQTSIDNLSAEQSAIYTELNNAYNQISALQAEAEELLANLEADDSQIAALQEEIAQLEEIIGKRESLLAEQARKVQVQSGSANYLNYVASAESLSDLVGRADVVNKMISANKDAISIQKADKESVEAKQLEAESAKQARLSRISELENIKAELASQTATQELAYNQLASDISLASEQRDALVAERTAFEEQQRIAAEQATIQAQAEMEASVAAAAQAESDAELQAAYEQALAEAEAQDAAIAAAQAEADAAAQAEAEAAAYAAQAEATAAEAAAYAESVAAEVEYEEVVVEQPVEAPVEEVPVTEEVMVEEAPVAEEDTYTEEYVEPTYEEVVTEEPVEEVVYEEPSVEYTEPVYETVEVDNSAEIAAAEEAAAAAQAEAEAAAQAAAAAAEQNASAQANVQTLLNNAAQYIGTPYVWGGKTPAGFDCSGFVQYVFQETYGINVGNWTGEQQYAGDVISVGEAQAGDLYFWGTPGGSTSHVAIATGGGEYIHASQPGSPLGYNNVQWYTPQFAVRVAK